jgi:hypothetical protein
MVPPSFPMTGSQSAVLFLLVTAGFIAVGVVLLPLSPQQDGFNVTISNTTVASILLCALFLWSICNAKTGSQVYSYLIVGFVLYAPLSFFLLGADSGIILPYLSLPSIYLIHVFLASVHLSLCSNTSRDRKRLGDFGFADFLVCLSVSILFWLSLGHVPSMPGYREILQSDAAAATLVRPLVFQPLLTSHINSFLGLRIASAIIGFTIFSVVAMALAIREGPIHVPPLGGIQPLDFGRSALLKPFEVLTNGFIRAVNRVVSLLWHIVTLLAVYFWRWLVDLIELFLNRLVFSGILKGFFRTISCYGIWVIFIVIAKFTPRATIRLFEVSTAHFSALIFQIIQFLGVGIAGIALLWIMARLEPTNHDFLDINMEHGVAWLFVGALFAAVCLKVATEFGLIPSGGFFRFGPFFLMCGIGISCVILFALGMGKLLGKTKQSA